MAKQDNKSDRDGISGGEIMGIALITDVNTIMIRDGKSVTADIWVILDGDDFPKKNWNDFVIVILGWWAAALLRLLRDASEREMLNFMDGPYSIEITKVGSDVLRFRALEGINRKNEICICESHAMSFVFDIISQSRNLLDVCRGNNEWSNDANILKASLDALDDECCRYGREGF